MVPNTHDHFFYFHNLNYSNYGILKLWLPRWIFQVLGILFASLRQTIICVQLYRPKCCCHGCRYLKAMRNLCILQTSCSFSARNAESEEIQAQRPIALIRFEVYKICSPVDGSSSLIQVLAAVQRLYQQHFCSNAGRLLIKTSGQSVSTELSMFHCLRGWFH